MLWQSRNVMWLVCLAGAIGGVKPCLAQTAGPIADGSETRTVELSARPRQAEPGMPAVPGPEGRQPDMATDHLVAPSPPSLLAPDYQPIDLNTALRLGGVQNPDILLARQLVVQAVAQRQLAAAQLLPTLNLGTNYDTHTGVLQQSNGNILSVNRSALFVGSGANAVAAGTVNIPGVVLGGNIAEGIFAYLISRQVVAEREFGNFAMRNQRLGQVAIAYSELTRAEARRAIAVQIRDEAREIARLTAEYAASGEGRKADEDRAASELAKREANLQRAEGDVLVASARLCQLINLDPSIRLFPTDAWVVPMSIVPPPMPIQELLALALVRRPEMGERRAVVREALLALEGAKILPFSPTVLLGFSAGGFGGGSNLVRPFFGGFGQRTDFDAIGYWSIRNMGVGNVALINLANAKLQASRYQELGILNRVREEVAESYALAHTRFAQIGTTEQAVRSSRNAFEEDFNRIKARAERDVLPIELLNSFRLLASSRDQYIDAIVDYNNSQFALYVAMGQPPAAALSRPVPTGGFAPSTVSGPPSETDAAPGPEVAPPADLAPPGPEARRVAPPRPTTTLTTNRLPAAPAVRTSAPN